MLNDDIRLWDFANIKILKCIFEGIELGNGDTSEQVTIWYVEYDVWVSNIKNFENDD